MSTPGGEVDAMLYELPTALEFGGRAWAINADYRDVLRVLAAFGDPDLTDGEKAYVCLRNLYPQMVEIPPEQMQAAFDAALAFIDGGRAGGERPGPRTMDWEQDAPLIFPAVNRAAGFEVRSAKFLHWWTFLGYFMEIRDSTFATVLSLRAKRARGKKLEKHEQEYWRDNPGICRLREPLTAAERAERERLREAVGG